MASRSRSKAEKAIEELKMDTGKEAIFLELDLASYASIHKAADEFLSNEPELHVLFNNALHNGVMWAPVDMLGPENHDLQWFTNVLHTIDWDSLKDGPARQKMSTVNLYCQSKFLSAGNWQRYAHQGIISISLNPGRLFIVQPAYRGALTQLWAGTMPEALNHNAGFLIPWARVDKCRQEAYDNELGEKLWNLLEGTVKDK
ncbi:hypothetical protein C8Q72DRAFT_874690 [Fomitopsis betulina]|nr:hypothetical protein C8Q72DRAFT_874690 [Fomitopsis betulina]